ncbi:MAG: hypothetical protein V3T05_07640 [Myxococcota bacterium]
MESFASFSVLVSKYDGSLAVDRDQEGWAKAVVVKLPREEAPREAPAKDV